MIIKRILVVDDSEADQFLSKYMIESVCKEIDVLQAYNGKEALNLIDELDQKPDLIFFDINMPIMNGLEFLDIYTKSDQPCSVVMLTSSDDQNDRDRCMAYGCVQDYILKPLDREYILNIAGQRR